MAAAASEEKQLISDEWTVEVQKFLEDRKKDGRVSRTIMRVSRALINAKAEAYIPQMLSLGPYHHRSLQEEPMGPYHHLSQMDIYKLNSTVDATKNKPVVDFFTKIKDKSSEFEQFYDWKINDRETFGWMMTVDALFLYQFLKNGLHLLQLEATLSYTSRYGEILTPTLTSIRCDIMKLENQIPLSLLREIDRDLNFNTTEDFLKTQISHLSCFLVPPDVKISDYEEESHLLGCMHTYLSFLQIQKSDERNPTCYERFMTAIDDMVAFVFSHFIRRPARRSREDFLEKYNAKELAKAGIKFKSASDKIRFDRLSDTLFLPTIVISHTYTEVMLRNLRVLEFNDTKRAKHVVF